MNLRRITATTNEIAKKHTRHPTLSYLKAKKCHSSGGSSAGITAHGYILSKNQSRA